jgi:hypothetical protein
VAVPTGRLMKIALEDILTGGLGLVVMLCAIAGVLAWITWMRRLGFWHFLGTPSAPLAPAMADPWAKYHSVNRVRRAVSVSYSGGLRACPPKK